MQVCTVAIPGGLDRVGGTGQPVTTHDQHVRIPGFASSAQTPAQNFRAFNGLHPDPQHVLTPSRITPRR